MPALRARQHCLAQDEQGRRRRHIPVVVQYAPGVDKITLLDAQDLLRRLQHFPSTRVEQETVKIRERQMLSFAVSPSVL